MQAWWKSINHQQSLDQMCQQMRPPPPFHPNSLLPSALSPVLTLFTAVQMLNPPNYTIVLSLEGSIRQRIGFLLKAAEPVGVLTHQLDTLGSSSRRYSVLGFACCVSFSELLPAAEKILKVAKRNQTMKSVMLQERRTEQEEQWASEGGKERERRRNSSRQGMNSPSGALYPVLSHSVISAVSLIFSDKDKIKVAYLLLLPPLRAVTQEKTLASG